jgi:hypothetical protein
VLDRVLQGQDATLGLSLVTDICVLLVHAHHDSRVLGAAHNGGEHRARGIVASETSLSSEKDRKKKVSVKRMRSLTDDTRMN